MTALDILIFYLRCKSPCLEHTVFCFGLLVMVLMRFCCHVYIYLFLFGKPVIPPISKIHVSIDHVNAQGLPGEWEKKNDSTVSKRLSGAPNSNFRCVIISVIWYIYTYMIFYIYIFFCIFLHMHLLSGSSRQCRIILPPASFFVCIFILLPHSIGFINKIYRE